MSVGPASAMNSSFGLWLLIGDLVILSAAVNDKAGCQYKTAKTAFVKSYGFIYLVLDFGKCAIKMLFKKSGCGNSSPSGQLLPVLASLYLRG